jgi:hypothetical protein
MVQVIAIEDWIIKAAVGTLGTHVLKQPHTALGATSTHL